MLFGAICEKMLQQKNAEELTFKVIVVGDVSTGQQNCLYSIKKQKIVNCQCCNNRLISKKIGVLIRENICLKRRNE